MSDGPVRRGRSVGPAGDSADGPAEALPKSRGLWKYWPEGFAGVGHRGVFDAPPKWVDVSLPPGSSDQTDCCGWHKTLMNTLSLKYFFMSPALVWFAIALTMHLVNPYDLDAARQGWKLDWVLRRFAFNYAVCFGYYAYFFAGLYCLSWSSRKFRPGVMPTAGNMLHNMWYWSLAIVQWTLWEAVMMRLWATGKVPFASDTEVFATWDALALNALWALLIPIWRDLHFYIAHRFIHIRAVYKYVHSLHHRNSDPEPFSGMTMHPIEHLYYFSNAFIPSLYLGVSPFIFLWCYVHLTFAPGAGHSGWEDHWQSDQYHWLHHAKFECNYGSPYSGFIDQYFGTFRESVGKSKQYKGQWDEVKVRSEGVAESTPAAADVWSPQGYLGMPASATHLVYTLFWVALFPVSWWAFVANHGGDRVTEIAGIPIGVFMGALLAYSPPAFAMLLCTLSGDKMSWRWPFHKEKFLGAFGFFLVLGWLGCLLPVYHATKWISE